MKSSDLPTSTLFDPVAFDASLAAGTSLCDTLKTAISTASSKLDQRFHHNDDIRDLIHDRSDFFDALLARAWQQFDWPAGCRISLIAVGGYGRGELHPHSDIDLLILLDEESRPACTGIIEQFVTLLWDLHLEIGHSVRTIADCVEQAKADITVTTNLMECHTIIGDEQLRLDMMDAVAPDKLWPSADFFRAKWDEQNARHSKFEDTEYNLEPNLKSCPGGLRDIQTIDWVAKRHFRTNRLSELKLRNFLSEQEYNTLRQGQNFLWRIRYGLHIVANRCEDRLLFDHQRTLAQWFGYIDNDEKLGVEQLMQEYYRWAMELSLLNEVLIQYLDEAILKDSHNAEIQLLSPRFQASNQYIEARHDQVFAKTPSALLEIFILLANNENLIGVRASTIRLIRSHLHLIDDQFRNSRNNKRLFIDLLKSTYKVTTQLMRMNRYGVLGRYLPEFGRIIGQMQHDLFHIYTVDAHTLQVIRNMRRFFYPDQRELFPIAAHTASRLPKVELLYIAGLYHDIAKGRGGDHSTLGAVDAIEFCQRHGFNRRDTELVDWLIRNHLLMSAIAQRKDISDPEVIREFATTIGDQVHLDYLYTLTVADINATNPTLWNSWRASLMHQLYTETKRLFRRGVENPVNRKSRITANKQQAIFRLNDKGYSKEQILAIWDNPEDEYFLRETPGDIAWHTEGIAQHQDPDQPLVLIKESGGPFDRVTQIFIYMENRDYMFAVIASLLEQLNLNIQGARIFTTASGRAMDSFFVLDENGHSINSNSQRVKKVQSTLVSGLRESNRFLDIVQRRIPRQLKHFAAPTLTHLFQDTEKGHTVLEVTTPDRPGLLARIGRIFIELNIKLVNARITTLGERVEDIFFITDDNQQPIHDLEKCEKLQQRIREELDRKATA